MADNVAITPGTGATVAADDIGGGVLAQRVKLVLGPDGTGNDALAGSGVNGTGVQRVSLATDDAMPVAVGAQADAAAAADNSTASLIALIKRNNQRLTSLIALLPTAIGNTTKAASLGVALASDDLLVTAMGAQADSAAASDTSTASLVALTKRNNQNLSTLHTDVTATNTQLPTTPSGAVQATITRPANTTQYAAGDVVGGAITLATGLTSGQRCMLTSMDLMLQIAALPGTPGMTTLDVHFYNVTPPSAIADNGVFDIPSGDRASYLGKVSLTTPIDYGSTLMSQLDNINKQFQLSGSSNLFAYLVTTTSYTPAANSEVYLLRAHFLGL